MILGSNQVLKSTSMASSSVSWKSGDVVPDQFPAGLRVLVVDDDPTCLMILEKMLSNCRYEATKCNRAEVALSLLRENKNGFDIVISDVHMPDMDGFKLLEHIGLEMDLPVIMMSADDSKSVVMKGVTHGACDYLIKPVRIEALRNIWQHVVRKRKHEWKDLEPSGSVEDGDRQQKTNEDADYSSSANEGNWKSSSKRRKDEEDEGEGEERDDSSSLKKPRVVWSVELHQQFVGAVNQLGIDKAVPKKILELMNVPGLTRENVASHLQTFLSHPPLASTHNKHLLQKYRLYLRRLSGSQHQGGLNNPFMGPTDPSFGSMSSLNGLDLQALAATGQIQAQSLANLQALGRPGAKSPISMPLDQRNLFSFENPKFHFGDGHPVSNNSSKQMNLLHGIPTNMDSKQLANLHQSAHSFGGNQVNSHGSQNGPLLIPMGQPQSRQAMLARNGLGDNVRGTGYNPVSQSSSIVDFSGSQNQVLPGNGFPILSSKGGLHEEVNSEVKVSRGIIPSYDIFNELNQHKSQDWGLQNVGLTFDASQHQHTNMQGSHDVPPSVLLQQSFPGQKIGQNRNSGIGKPVFSVGEDGGPRSGAIIGQQINSFFGDNGLRVKSERFPEVRCQNTLFAENFGQEDLMSALLKQQEGIGSADSEFGFDGYPLDNLPV